MELFAYPSLLWESEPTFDFSATLAKLKIFRCLNWQKLSSLAWHLLLKVALNLAILSIALHSLAEWSPETEPHLLPASGGAIAEFSAPVEQVLEHTPTLETLESSLLVAAAPTQANASGTAQIPTETLIALGPSSTTASSRSTTLELQRLLTSQGFYRGAIDGIYGSRTRAAVRSAQQAYGLVVDGIAGPQTLAALRRRSTSTSSSTSSASAYSASTAEVQRLLANQGFYRGAIDGIYGPQTRAAVRSAQQAYGLVVDGVAGSQTLSALRRPSAASSSSARSASTYSADTAELQRLLANQGFYQGAIDGIYGPQTRAAVRSAQQAYGLVVDGAAGSQTLSALRRPSTPSSPSASPASTYSADTAELQKLLTSQGFYSGPIDGIYGTQTRSAVRSAQQVYGLIVDGVAGPQTLNSLRRIPQSAPSFTPERPRQTEALPVPVPPPPLRPGDATSVTPSGQIRQNLPAGGTVISSRTLYIQRLLSAKGFYQGPIDGVYGPRTRDGVIQAQRYYGLVPDGMPTPLIVQYLER